MHFDPNIRTYAKLGQNAYHNSKGVFPFGIDQGVTLLWISTAIQRVSAQNLLEKFSDTRLSSLTRPAYDLLVLAPHYSVMYTKLSIDAEFQENQSAIIAVWRSTIPQYLSAAP